MSRRRAGPGPDLSTRIASVRLPNPVMTAAGTSGHGAELGEYVDLSRLGGVVVKSLSARPWPGNASPRVCAVPGGMLNSVGLQGEGIERWAETDLVDLDRAAARTVVSIWGRTVQELADAAEMLSDVLASVGPHRVVALEVNMSCPNLEDRGTMFAHSASGAAEAIDATSRAGLPLWAKLSPNTPDIVEIAGAALGTGAESLTLVNTLYGLAIDTTTSRPVLGAIGGGLSGPALHAVALRAVYDCRRAFPDAGIVGVGGISDGEGALRMLLAGADAVQVGTATLADPRAPGRVLDQLEALVEKRGCKTVAELVGAAQVLP